jgi:hypothetical protein
MKHYLSNVNYLVNVGQFGEARNLGGNESAQSSAEHFRSNIPPRASAKNYAARFHHPVLNHHA